IQLALRQLLPTAVTPAFVPMRPNASLDPMVEFVEERSDVSTFVIVTPPPTTGFSCSIRSLVFKGTPRLVSWRTRSLKRWIDFPPGYAYNPLDLALVTILLGGS